MQCVSVCECDNCLEGLCKPSYITVNQWKMMLFSTPVFQDIGVWTMSNVCVVFYVLCLSLFCQIQNGLPFIFPQTVEINNKCSLAR